MLEFSETLPDNSVHMVFTDPVYTKKHVYMYEHLGAIAQRVLVPGGYLCAYVGGSYLPYAIHCFERANLEYFWLDVVLNKRQKPRMWHKKLMVGAKFLIIFTKGAPRKKSWRGTVHENTQDKRYHKWAKGYETAKKLTELFTNPGEIIYDPFFGGGSTACGVIAAGEERSYIGVEILPEVVESAMANIAEFSSLYASRDESPA